jgi:TldD protein
MILTPTKTHGDIPISTSELTRRSFLGAAGVIAGTLAISQMVPRPLRAQLGRSTGAAPAITDPSIKAFVFRGVQAAHDAGASFAEVRLSHTLQRTINTQRFSDSHTIHAGVQAYVDGVWGFASGAVWNDEDIVQLANAAVAQAREISRARVALQGIKGGLSSELSARPNDIQSGHWVTPIKEDPFAIHPHALQDALSRLTTQLSREFPKQGKEGAAVSLAAVCIVQERAYGASDNTFVTQRLYKTGGDVHATLTAITSRGVRRESRRVPLITMTGMGWELFAVDTLRKATFETLERIREDILLISSPITTGRRSIVLDAKSTGTLLSNTIGLSTELDRALGYSGDSNGFGWLGHPATMLGKFLVGSPLLTVTANRSEVGGAATVKWDDEGVVPQPVTLIKDGVLTHYQQTRVGAQWLASVGSTTPSSSTGAASASNAGSAPAVSCANLVMAGASTGAIYDDLLKQIGDGIAFEDVSVSVDSTCRTGLVMGRAYEVSKGKKVARLTNAGFLLDASALWRSLSAVGGAESAIRQGEVSRKGYYGRHRTWHSVTAVPAAFTSQVVIDVGVR